MNEFDPGPPASFATIFGNVPDYGVYKSEFWYDWGPVFYRGRLDGTARVLCIASDPGPTERVACRTLVGDAGQRVQGFLTKLGLTRSYVCVNAFAYALFPSNASDGKKILSDPVQMTWRNGLLDAIGQGSPLQAVIAFGAEAQIAASLWPGIGSVPLFNVPHPSDHDAQTLITHWQAAIPQIRAVVTPDPDGSNTGPNYGAAFAPGDYTAIPKRDLPFGVPPWFGDDGWGRNAVPPHADCVNRPKPDDRHTLIWVAPKQT